jgi:hypothetical protein
MSGKETTAFVHEVMASFAERTGLTGGAAPRRYLWTDAFAVCNFLGLARRTGDRIYLDLALRLIDQVHRVLGRHRLDDKRSGWISGLGEREGARHPTRGGLRIGKPLRERRADEPLDERREWDRDGQYFHYLTKWMHALARAGRETSDARQVRWGLELAETAYDRFTSAAEPGGRRRMVWKMSIDLSRPLVEDMGQHDPLDGLVSFLELRAAAEGSNETVPPDLDGEVASLAAMCKGARLASADPLGIGGLLTAAHTLARLTAAGVTGYGDLLASLVEQSLPGLENQLAKGGVLSMPRDYRLAFRELGLSIGLRAAARMQDLLAASPAAFDSVPDLGPRLERVLRHAPLIQLIETFWLDPANRRGASWKEHEDINSVMLATSLAPEGYFGA